MQFTNQGQHDKHYDWFSLVNKYLRDKIKRTSLALTDIWPNKTKILLHHCALPYSVRFRKSFQITDQFEQQTLGHLELFSDYVRGLIPN